LHAAGDSAGVFHVKHSSKSPGNPDEIGHLARLEFAPTVAEIGLDAAVLDRLERFTATLALWGEKTNLTAHPDDPAEIAFHIRESLTPLVVEPKHGLQDIFAEGRQVVDIGSGAGFPGLVLAAATRAEFILVEPRRKRAGFLDATALAMRLNNVRVVNGRASEVDEAASDVATARAVKLDDELLKSAARALRADGCLIIYASADQGFPLVGEFEPPRRIAYTLRHGGRKVSRALIIATRR
jgi:16S rRNA (guanine(527)-N(7))-methyltransferase RsmG